jgi:hypothetical protein
MTTDVRALISASLGEMKAAHAAQARASSRLELALEATVQEGFNALPSCNVPPSEHRRAHRPGKARIIPADPALQAFIRARIDSLTYVQIAAEVAAHFPPSRRVGKSAIQDWWKGVTHPAR